MKVFCVVGYSNSGKTTLIEKVIPILRERGLSVLAIKHARRFEVDREGKDSWRLFRSGADVIVTSKEKTAFVSRFPDNLEFLLEIFGRLYDVVIVEGFKSSNYPKIVVLKDEREIPKLENVVAVVSDFEVDFNPRFRRDDYEGVADFIIKKIKV